ncbi:MAG TPA: ATP-binding protein [Pyrinomonadaceae bacterium]|nr:ATP-binding protein [Pyrinomonadaceae bacterium]
MPKRNAYLFLACVVFVAVVLLLPSFTARAVGAILLLICAVVVLARAVSNKTSSEVSQLTGDESNHRDEQSSKEIFALGKLFEATMNGMREGLLVVDKDMRIVASNTAAHRLFNLSAGKLNAQRLTELTRNPAIYSAFLDALKGTERSGVKVETHGAERLVFDLRVVPLARSNGSARVSRDAGESGAEIRPPTRPAEGALGVFIDITRIERLESVRQEFLSNVSHELRTPLTAILAFVETLEAGAIDDSESAHRFLSIISKNASRMNDLIGDILELSAIEAGNVSVRTEQVELNPIVNDVISSLAKKVESQGVSVINAVESEATIFADARRLEQMLTNLVDNAIKFTRENGQVTVRFESGKLNGRDKIIVEDTGEGIPAQHLERLFERFYRVDRARSRELGGTGLGLAIVKHLARAHGGEVTVTSEVGRGSNFTIELPTNDPLNHPNHR